MVNRVKSTPDQRALFLDILAETCSVTRAASATTVHRGHWYKLKWADPEFSIQWDQAVQIGVRALEDEMVRRAHEGTLKPVFHNGVEVGKIREYSDLLLIFALKAHAPEKYRERFDVTSRQVQTVTHNINLANLDDRQLAALAGILDAAAAGGADEPAPRRAPAPGGATTH